MIKPCTPADMKIIWIVLSLAVLISSDDLKRPRWYRHSFFTNHRNQTCLSVVLVFCRPPSLNDRLWQSNCNDRRWCQVWKADFTRKAFIYFHLKFLEIQIFFVFIHPSLFKLRFLNQGLMMMMIVGNSGFDRLCKTEKSFCLQLEASLRSWN